MSVIKDKHIDTTLINDRNCFPFHSDLDMHGLLTTFLSGDESVWITYKNRREEVRIWDRLRFFFLFHKAAGGLVIKEDALLSIFRFGCWDLPKGHVETGEKDSVAAMREVREETGISRLLITEDLDYTHHIYPLEDRFVLKETHWYKMQTSDNNKPVPQKEEAIEDVRWIPLKNIDLILQNTYPSLIDLLKRLLSEL
ncbi:MAG: NUDIX domain-containing protein [Bacteroidales bacterium]|nr:NUDIX domain-containing protein [Bacteroidales bacterium]